MMEASILDNMSMRPTHAHQMFWVNNIWYHLAHCTTSLSTELYDGQLQEL